MTESKSVALPLGDSPMVEGGRFDGASTVSEPEGALRVPPQGLAHFAISSIIGIEDLQVSNMVKNRKLSKAIRSQLVAIPHNAGYKANWYKEVSKKLPFQPAMFLLRLPKQRREESPCAQVDLPRMREPSRPGFAYFSFQNRLAS